MAGVFISKGMQIIIPTGGLKLSVGKDGKLKGSLALHLRFDVCPTWIELAKKHAETALEHRAARDAIWQHGSGEEKAEALEREFEASMQSMMASAIAMDAFYATLRDHVSIPETLSQRWRESRTPRYAQVTEVIKRAFRLKRQGVAALRQNLTEIYRCRDLAVHPPAEGREATYHPEIGVAVEWRFAVFRATHAQMIFDATSGMLSDLANNGKPPSDQIRRYIETLRVRLNHLSRESE